MGPIMTERVALYRRKLSLLAAAWTAISVPTAIAQVSAAPHSARAAVKKPVVFDVVSIRPSKPGSPEGITGGILPDGYRARGQSLRSTIMLAYFPPVMSYRSKDRILGAPPWIGDRYDIEAKVAPSDMAEWQKQGNTLEQKKMLQEMLQTMLAERCKLVVHHIPAEIPGYALEVGKHGPKFKDAKPNENFPQNSMKLADGGVLVVSRENISFYGASMASLVSFLQSDTLPLLQDKTSLTGKYDFVLQKRDDATASENDPDPSTRWEMEELGLTLKSVKIPTETLVIDHIERPSEN